MYVCMYVRTYVCMYVCMYMRVRFMYTPTTKQRLQDVSEDSDTSPAQCPLMSHPSQGTYGSFEGNCSVPLKGFGVIQGSFTGVVMII